jgi:hypothetical protein
MDSNGLRFWQVAGARGFSAGGGARDLHWRADARLLRLDRQQAAPVLAEDRVFARAQVSAPSPVCDAGGSFAWWDGGAGTLRAAGFGEGATPVALPPDIPPGIPAPTDLAFGDDDVLYVARNDGVIMADRRERWQPARVDLDGFQAHRLAPAPGGGVWVLDRVANVLARLSGHPLRTAGLRAEGSERFHPVEPNPKPPAMKQVRSARLPANVEAVALAGSQQGRVAVLCWRTGENALIFTLEGRKFVRRFALEGLMFPYGLAWVGEDRLAVLASDALAAARQAFVYDLDATPDSDGAVRPSGEVFRTIDPWPGNFCNRLDSAPHYLVAPPGAATPVGVRRLRALSRATYARTGSTMVGPFDAGVAGTVWHRLYAEAAVPDHCGIRIWAHADDRGARPPAPGEADAPDWALHVIGGADDPDNQPDAARASWCDERSELPFDPGLLTCASVPGRSGLFTALMQRPGIAVRRVAGRWLWLHVELTGDSQVTPELAAIRAYAKRGRPGDAA